MKLDEMSAHEWSGWCFSSSEPALLALDRVCAEDLSRCLDLGPQ